MLTVHHSSEFSLLCSLSPPAELHKQQKLWLLAEHAQQIPDVQEVIVGMNNLTIFFTPQETTQNLPTQIQQLWAELQQHNALHQGRYIEIPVHYGGEFGEDLFDVAKYHQTTPEEIIRRHTEPIYTVFMMGFQPGFPYLGGLPENLHTPRRNVPRTKVPAGSVGIGGSQTGVYPFTSPGGWQLLGRTDIQLFDVNQTPPVLLMAGDNIRFVAESVRL